MKNFGDETNSFFKYRVFCGNGHYLIINLYDQRPPFRPNTKIFYGLNRIKIFSDTLYKTEKLLQCCDELF